MIENDDRALDSGFGQAHSRLVLSRDFETPAQVLAANHLTLDKKRAISGRSTCRLHAKSGRLIE